MMTQCIAHLSGRGEEGRLTGEEGRSGLPASPSVSSSSSLWLFSLSTPNNSKVDESVVEDMFT